MQDLAQKREEFERLWKNPSFLQRWSGRWRKRFTTNLEQRRLKDADGAWNADRSATSDWDNTPSSPVLSNSTGPRDPAVKPRRRKNGNPEFILPDPVIVNGTTHFPLAEKIGAHPEQLAQAAAMSKAGLKSKAQRKAHCGVLGERRDCYSKPEEHRFYVPYKCGNRYCPDCGPRIFKRLFAKYMMLEGVARRLVPHWPVKGRCPARVIAKIDFTIRNTGEMPTPDAVRKFNRDIRKFFRLLETRLGISRKEYGVVWSNEFGGSNTNLHAHAVYAGPFLSQKKKELSALWSEVVGEQAFVSIKAAGRFPAALAHALKYPSKYIQASAPQRRAELEKVFHRVRRVHTLAGFYNVKPGDALEPPEGYRGSNSCPHCESPLIKVSGWRLRPIPELVKAGLKNLDDVRQTINRERAFGPRGAPTASGPLNTNKCEIENST